MRTTIPHAAVLGESGEVTKASLNELIRRALAASSPKPCALEIYDSVTQRVLFLRDGQIYAAAESTGGQYSPTSIRDFLVGVSQMSFPRACWYELNTKILHSLLVVSQKKPALRVATNLVDLDELLDKIEGEGKSSIVAATREDFFALLRYEKGRAAALCMELSAATPREGTFREEFLVKVYTRSAEKPLTISLFEDFLVSYAPDAKNLPESFAGRFEDVFLSKPPVVVLRFKDREIGRWEVDRPRLRIGRTPDNDIVIDNLAVSRLHALIEEEKGGYFVRDCDSLNGTEVNGARITRRKLEDGDEITIAKHTIQFRVQGGHAVAEPEAMAGFDQTMIFQRSSLAGGGPHAAPTPAPHPAPHPTAHSHDPSEGHDTRTATMTAVDASKRPPRLVVHTEFGDRIVEIEDDGVVIGKDQDADVHVAGMFVAGRHAEIIRENGRTILRRVGGLRPVRVGGRTVKEIELKDNDEIQIASESFVFHE
ncbi:MAG: FHA domain-containing protein [Candidatus Latescibacteria bacterium]|nr:FHA domain-containing protein [Candidatus Latescibacterota bacterium]